MDIVNFSTGDKNETTIDTSEMRINTQSFVIPELNIETTDFVSRWDTRKIEDGSSGLQQIKLPLDSSGTYNFTIDWGDDSSDNITNWDQAEVTHDYDTAGEYTLIISGTVIGWRFANAGDKLKIIEISQWGNLTFGDSHSYFYGAKNLQLTATDAPDLSLTTSLWHTFIDCEKLGSTGSMNSWNVSTVTNLDSMFFRASSFNQPLGDWDVSNVEHMTNMFAHATSFNRPIGDWDVSSVKSMNGMFAHATSFNKPLEDWDVSNVEHMDVMFSGAEIFNQPIGNWDVSFVTDMSFMFQGASTFNQPLNDWDVSSVTKMNWMFSGAISFDQSVGDWNVSNVTEMLHMFNSVELSTSNYDDILIGWAKLTLQNNVSFHGGDSIYSHDAADDRQHIIDTYNWTITDLGGEREPFRPPRVEISYSDGQVRLSWGDAGAHGVAEITHYLIYRSLTSGGDYVKNGVSETQEYSDDDVVVGETYYYVITAVNIVGEGDYSDEVSITIPESDNEAFISVNIWPVMLSILIISGIIHARRKK